MGIFDDSGPSRNQISVPRFPLFAATFGVMGAASQGEANHDKGRQGAHRAKRWLEGTSRAVVPWVNPENGSAAKMTCQWPHGGLSFSFDLLGYLKHGPQENSNFYCEVKNYSGYSNLNDEYLDYLAKCYVMLGSPMAPWCDHFMWIAWHPHSVTSWSDLTSREWVEKGVRRNKTRIFGPEASEADIEKMLDQERCSLVAERQWLIILNDKQETFLTLAPEHLALIRANEVGRDR